MTDPPAAALAPSPIGAAAQMRTLLSLAAILSVTQSQGMFPRRRRVERRSHVCLLEQ